MSAQTHVQRSRPQPHCGWQAMPARGAPKVRDEAVGRERARAVQHAPGNGRDGQPCCETRRGRRRLGVPFAREPRRRAMTRLQAPRFSPGRRGDRNRLLARHAVAPHFPSLCLQPLGVCFSSLLTSTNADLVPPQTCHSFGVTRGARGGSMRGLRPGMRHRM